MFTLALVLVTIVAMATAYPSYQTQIPNGESVPSPCGMGTWSGVGHMLARGTGQLNPFGQSFAAEGHVWTDALCRADSDKDGVSNGEELGDPHCHWTTMNTAHLSAAKSHPGICEPVGSDKCAWQTFKC